MCVFVAHKSIEPLITNDILPKARPKPYGIYVFEKWVSTIRFPWCPHSNNRTRERQRALAHEHKYQMIKQLFNGF